MGIFSLFGKKEGQPTDTSADAAPLRRRREDVAPRPETPSEIESTKSVQRRAAHATALKIDAIESEMSSEFVRPQSPSAAPPVPNAPIVPVAPVAKRAVPPAIRSAEAPAVAVAPAGDVAASGVVAQPKFEATSPGGKSATEFLMGTETVYGAKVALSVSETAPVIEEAAILFANDQMQMVEGVLLAAIGEETLGNASLTVWHMLFDLYQISGDRVQFDNLSIEFANKFEISPPAWIGETPAEEPASNAAPTGAVPTVSFSGALDAGIIRQLEKAQNLAGKSRVLRLEFARVTNVDPIGCGLLLSILKKLQKSGHDLILVGAFELTGKIRAILEVGRRDETEAPWLLLLEVLRLLNLESDFEEASIDYCVTFEVSPPAFVAPKNKITTALDVQMPNESQDSFAMPAVITEGASKLIASISAYAEQHYPAVIDCTPLQRVNFGAAGELLAGLAPLAAKGASIELQNVNHLVAALFAVMGLTEIVRVVPRKS